MSVSEIILRSIVSFRRWLKRNQIFFSIFGTILLSIMAIYVSYAAVSISSYQANQVEMENQPQFLFTMENVPYKSFISPYNEPSNWSNDYLVIKNEGKPFKNLKVEYTIITGVEYYSFDRNQNKMIPKDFQIPLEHYVNDNPQIDSDGYIRINQIFPRSYTNSEKYDRLLTSFQNYIRPKGDMLYYIDLSRYLKIQYTDIYNKNHDKYYIINNRAGSQQISKEEYEKIMARVNFSEIPADISDYFLLYNVQPGGVQYNSFNETILEPWYHAFKKKFDES